MTEAIISGRLCELGPHEIDMLQEHTFGPGGGLMHYGIQYAAKTPESKYYMALGLGGRGTRYYIKGVAIVIAYHNEPTREGVEWFQVYVRREARRKGLGTRLFRAAERDFKNISVDGDGDRYAAAFFNSIDNANWKVFPSID